MNEILQILIDQWKYDIAVMSQGWMYYWILIPIISYLIFFFLKWTVITAPVWLPFYLVLNGIKVRIQHDNTVE